jgi:small subunit ribosomal protein S6
MKSYELTYLISPDLSEEDLKNFSGKISNFIQEDSGLLEKTTEPSKKKLGYPIKEKEEAFLIVLSFSLSPEKLESLEKKLKSENQILRYLILTKKTPETLLPKLQPRTIPSQTEVSAGLAVKEPNKPLIHQPKDEKVELKEIDKKIEEILGE